MRAHASGRWVAIGVVALAALALFVLGRLQDRSGRDGAPGPHDTTTATARAQLAGIVPPRRQPPLVRAHLRVNGATTRQLGTGAPVLVRLTVQMTRNDADAELPVAALAQEVPGLSDQGRKVAASWRPLDPVVVAGGRIITLRWVLERELAPGRYDVRVPGAVALLEQAVGTGRVVVNRATLVRTPDPEPEALRSYYERRILSFEDPAALVRQLRQSLQQEPDNLRLRVELADALGSTGQPASALEQLEQAIGSLEPGAEIPESLALKLEELRRKLELTRDG